MEKGKYNIFNFEINILYKVMPKMFGYRSDGRKIKNVGPFFKVIPHIMKRRSDSHVYYSEDISLASMDDYIAKKEKEGIRISYMNIIYAAIVRIMAEKPCLNRFIMDGRIYARNEIFISLAIKKTMSENVEETVIKLPFVGSENIFEIKDKLEDAITKNKKLSAENSTDKLARLLAYVPNFLMKISINLLMYLDKIGLLPKSIINASPFHTSAFLTNVGSLGLDAIYHHIYDFGTTGMFLAMGKKKKSFIYDDDSFKEERSISLAWVADERICDGFYYANCIKAFKKYLKKPELLEQNIDVVKDIR